MGRGLLIADVMFRLPTSGWGWGCDESAFRYPIATIVNIFILDWFLCIAMCRFVSKNGYTFYLVPSIWCKTSPSRLIPETFECPSRGAKEFSQNHCFFTCVYDELLRSCFIALSFRTMPWKTLDILHHQGLLPLISNGPYWQLPDTQTDFSYLVSFHWQFD